MKTEKQEMCQASWMDKRGAGCGAIFPATDLREFVMKRYKNREATTVYLCDDKGSANYDEPVGWVWKADEWDNGYWRWCYDSNCFE